MSDNAAGRVVHLVPPNGGGVDRFVRDVCARRPADWLLHVSDAQCVVECASDGLFIPVATDQLPGLLQRGVFGKAAALHAHSTVAVVRRVANLFAASMGLRYAVTLHDVEFAGASDADGTEETQGRLDFIRGAAACTAPSNFIQSLALQQLGPSFHCTVIENGVDPQTAAPGRPVTDLFPIAVIGAMGQHKGLAHLGEVASRLPTDLPIVLLGYAEGQLVPGWMGDQRKIWVHGAFEPDELPTLIARYGVQVAFFPQGQPESYCYALSDAWLAGLPVVGPDLGAIGERVHAHGAGSLYQGDAPVDEVARLLVRQLHEAAGARIEVERAAGSLTSIGAMVERLNDIYAEIGSGSLAPDIHALQRTAANHLDSRFFRKELLRLQGDLAAAEMQRDNSLHELRLLSDNFDERGRWVDQLEESQQELRDAIDKLNRDLEESRQATEALRHALKQEYEQALQWQATRYSAIQAELSQLNELYTALRSKHETLVRRLTWPVQLLPATWQAWLKSTVKRVLSRKGTNG